MFILLNVSQLAGNCDYTLCLVLVIALCPIFNILCVIFNSIKTSLELVHCYCHSQNRTDLMYNLPHFVCSVNMVCVRRVGAGKL